MAGQVFTEEELTSLRRFPEIGREELFRFFTLPPPMQRSSTQVAAEVQPPGWALLFPCARCRGWVSYPMT